MQRKRRGISSIAWLNRLLALLISMLLLLTPEGEDLVFSHPLPRKFFFGLETFSCDSPALSAFSGRERYIIAHVLVPEDAEKGPHPIVFHFPGIGASRSYPKGMVPFLKASAQKDPDLVMTHVFLNPAGEWGYHFFVDSAANGPVGTALVKECLPAIERRFREGKRGPRFLTGTSSGAWTALWLQLRYPDEFDGVWAVSPDPVDFRSFFGIDITPGSSENMYFSSDGTPRYERRNGRLTLRTYIHNTETGGRKGSEFGSYEASFSPLDDHDIPLELFDRESGRLLEKTMEEWARFDLRRVMEAVWDVSPQKIRGKIHLFCGTQDTFFLDEPSRLFCRSLLEREPEATCELIPGRTHTDIYSPAPPHPGGLMLRILEAMARS